MRQKDNKKKKQSLKSLNDRYTQRITMAKQGQQASSEGDIRNAIKYYNMYLKILADVKDIPEVEDLAPEHFNPEKELSELLLISHIYWDLCKVFDLTPHLESEFTKTLEKFIEFTVGHKYQVVNAEMLRKFIRRGRHRHKKEFKEAYSKIFLSSKKCYIASHCFGELHPTTNTLRVFKEILTRYRLGRVFIDYYYRYSPTFVSYCDRHKNFSYFVTNFFLKPILSTFSQILRKLLS